ncbi:MAG: hydantoinase/oxoprolinase family protein [Rhizobiaceae bacterium]
MTEKKKARIGIDIGGTFTDGVLEVGGRRHTTKVPTTPAAPQLGMFDAIRSLLSIARIAPDDIALIVHGTTLATNALIERRGARTALITTEGFRDVLEMRGEDRYDQYSLALDIPAPLVPRRLRLPVAERMDARGNVLRALGRDALPAIVETLRREEVGSVAVAFLHSYANPAHEDFVADMLARELPGVPVSLSSQVSPEIREYERISTTCANAYIRPVMERYLASLPEQIREMGLDCPLLMMLSSGGLTSIETAMRFPVRLVESGPAGGAIFSSHIARSYGLDRVLAFDMGGTTAKLCLLEGSQPHMARSFEAARNERHRKGSGLPLRIPVIEMVEIGAGGGSIAHLDKLGRLAVGPESASSAPGPACYRRGGTRATVTDANLVIGRLDAATFAGGEMPLETKLAEQAVGRDVAAGLGLDVPAAARGIIEIVDEAMAGAARVHATERGRDIGEHTMIAFGGAAPLHAGHLAHKLKIDRFIIPRQAGVGSAVGFLQAPISYEIARTDWQTLADFDPARLNGVFAALSAQAFAVAGPASLGRPLVEHRMAAMRYVGQGYEIPVPLPTRDLHDDDVPMLADRFAKLYAAHFSRAMPDAPVEILTLSVNVTTEEEPVGGHGAGDPELHAAAPAGTRRVYDGATGALRDVQVFDRDSLAPGASIRGPAILVEAETTTILPAGFDAVIDRLGAIDCRRTAAMEARP